MAVEPHRPQLPKPPHPADSLPPEPSLRHLACIHFFLPYPRSGTTTSHRRPLDRKIPTPLPLSSAPRTPTCPRRLSVWSATPVSSSPSRSHPTDGEDSAAERRCLLAPPTYHLPLPPEFRHLNSRSDGPSPELLQPRQPGATIPIMLPPIPFFVQPRPPTAALHPTLSRWRNTPPPPFFPSSLPSPNPPHPGRRSLPPPPRLDALSSGHQQLAPYAGARLSISRAPIRLALIRVELLLELGPAHIHVSDPGSAPPSLLLRHARPHRPSLRRRSYTLATSEPPTNSARKLSEIHRNHTAIITGQTPVGAPITRTSKLHPLHSCVLAVIPSLPPMPLSVAGAGELGLAPMSPRHRSRTTKTLPLPSRRRLRCATLTGDIPSLYIELGNHHGHQQSIRSYRRSPETTQHQLHPAVALLRQPTIPPPAEA